MSDIVWVVQVERGRIVTVTSSESLAGKIASRCPEKIRVQKFVIQGETTEPVQVPAQETKS